MDVLQRAKLGLLPHVRRARSDIEGRIRSTFKRDASLRARRRSLLRPAMPIRERLLIRGAGTIRVGAFVHGGKRPRSRTIKGWCPVHAREVRVPGRRSTIVTFGTEMPCRRTIKGWCPVQTTEVRRPGRRTTVVTLGTEMPCRRTIGPW